jgi:hypothetical protein
VAQGLPELRGSFALIPLRNRDSPVGTTAGYRLDGCGLVHGRGQNLSVLHSYQFGSGAHLVYYPMGTGGSLHGVKRSELGADNLAPSSAEVKNCGAITPLPLMYLSI